jgi:hypothetical protein
MSDALEALRRELSTTPRDNEHLVFDTTSWSDEDKRRAFALLMDAARRGDTRAPAALSAVVSGAALEDALSELERDPEPAVRIEAAWERHTIGRARLYAAVRQDLVSGRLSRSTLERALGLLLQQSEAAGVMGLLDATPDEHARTVILEALWRHARLDLFPTPGWAGLGAFRRALLLPVASFRAPLLERFKRLLMTNPLAEGFPVRAWELPTPALRAAMREVDRGSAPVPTGAGLDPEEQHALLLHAAEQALGFAKPRALQTVAVLAGHAHRDLLEWARSHPLEPMRTAAEAALLGLASPA